jgi:transposase
LRFLGVLLSLRGGRRGWLLGITRQSRCAAPYGAIRAGRCHPWGPGRRELRSQRRNDRGILLASADQGLNKNHFRVSPHRQAIERTCVRLKSNDLFIFLADRRAVIEAERHPEVVAVSPFADEDEIGDLEREALGRGDGAALRQIAHNPAQATSRPATSVSVIRYGATHTASIREALRFEAVARIETPMVEELP